MIVDTGFTRETLVAEVELLAGTAEARQALATEVKRVREIIEQEREQIDLLCGQSETFSRACVAPDTGLYRNRASSTGKHWVARDLPAHWALGEREIDTREELDQAITCWREFRAEVRDELKRQIVLASEATDESEAA